LSRCDPRGYKGSRIQGVERNAKEFQRFESLAKVIKTLLKIYRKTTKFPKEERYGLISQIRRSVVSIPSIINP